MDWMYKNPSSVDPEEYLLGRAIDKNHFKETSPVNYMRSIKDEPQSSYGQAEMSRKIKEDPLTALKAKEIENKRLLFQKLQLKRNESLVPVAAVPQSEKKESKSIEQLIVENLRKLPCAVNLEKLLLNIKEEKKLKKLRKNSTRSPINKRKLLEKESLAMKKRGRSSSSTSSDSNPEIKKRRVDIQRSNDRRKITSHDSRKKERNSPAKSVEKEEWKQKSCRNNTEYCSKNQRKINENSPRRDRIRENSFEKSKERVEVRKKRFISEERETRRRREENTEGIDYERHKQERFIERDVRRRNHEYPDERDYEQRRRMNKNESPGSVREKNKKEKESRNDVGRRFAERKNNRETSPQYIKNRKSSRDRSKEKIKSAKKPTLTEEEKEARRKEMMANAVERDTERKKNVKRYALEDQKDEKIEKFDDDFARRQLSALMSSENSVEKRIKSNVYNIQRNNRDMDRNFARRY